MRERPTRIPFTCPQCGNSSDRGIRIGGLLSREFRCEKCDAHALASGYHFFSVLYGVLLTALALAGLTALDFFFGTDVRFEYFLVVVAAMMIVLIWLSAARYWKLVIRWTKVGQGN